MNSPTNIDDVIKEVALANGVALDRNDPIMVVKTLHDILLRDAQAAQQQRLDNFKSELELILHYSSESSKALSEKLINNSLIAAKQAIDLHFEETTNKAIEALEQASQSGVNQINEALKLNHQVAWLNIIGSVMVVGSIMVFLWFITH